MKASGGKVKRFDKHWPPRPCLCGKKPKAQEREVSGEVSMRFVCEKCKIYPDWKDAYELVIQEWSNELREEEDTNSFYDFISGRKSFYTGKVWNNAEEEDNG